MISILMTILLGSWTGVVQEGKVTVTIYDEDCTVPVIDDQLKVAGKPFKATKKTYADGKTVTGCYVDTGGEQLFFLWEDDSRPGMGPLKEFKGT